MKNSVQEGKTLSHTAAGNIASGDVVVFAERIGIAAQDISTGKTGSVDMEGVFELTSDTGTAYAQGDKLFWDASPGNLTKTAAGNTPAGEAAEAKLSASATAKVRLTAHPKQAAFVADAAGAEAADINAIKNALVAAGLMKSS